MKNLSKKEMAEKIERLESQLQDVREERKNQFNKYAFIEDLTEFLKNEIEKHEADEDSIEELINEQIDNECIYYRTCFEIAMELNITSWDDFAKEIGEIHSINQVAYMALRELVDEELDRSELIELIEARDNKEAEEA